MTHLAISRFQVMLLPIRGLRHNKITGRNKLNGFSLAKRTTLGPMSFCAPSPGITWLVSEKLCLCDSDFVQKQKTPVFGFQVVVLSVVVVKEAVKCKGFEIK